MCFILLISAFALLNSACASFCRSSGMMCATNMGIMALSGVKAAPAAAVRIPLGACLMACSPNTHLDFNFKNCPQIQWYRPSSNVLRSARQGERLKAMGVRRQKIKRNSVQGTVLPATEHSSLVVCQSLLLFSFFTLLESATQCHKVELLAAPCSPTRKLYTAPLWIRNASTTSPSVRGCSWLLSQTKFRSHLCFRWKSRQTFTFSGSDVGTR